MGRARAHRCSWLWPWSNPAAHVASLIQAAGLHDDWSDLLHLPPPQMLAAVSARLRPRLAALPAGERPLRMLGAGMDFARLREYTPGDDARALDWLAFARTRTPHVREHHEEKTLILWLVVDLSASMTFGSMRRKSRQALAMAVVVGMLALGAGYRVGLLTFDGLQPCLCPPRSGAVPFQALTQTLQTACLQAETVHDAAYRAMQTADPLCDALRDARHITQKRAWLVVFSDFLSDSPLWPAALAELGRTRTLSGALIVDPVERALPQGLGMACLHDAESGQRQWVSAQNGRVRRAFARHAQAHLQERLAHAGFSARCQTVSTTEDPVEAALTLCLAKAVPEGIRRC